MGTPPTSPFQVHVRADGDEVSLGLVGDLDLSAVECFQSCVEGAVESNDGGAVVVDMASLTFIDSTGITALLEVRRRLDTQGRTLRVENISPPAARIFELTGLTEVFMDGEVDPTPT